MWKKEEESQSAPNAPRREATVARNETPAASGRSRGPAIIGSSITIRGEVTGDEDLLIEGRVDGSVDLKQHSVTVGPEGLVKAGITARIVTVEGTVEGDLLAEEQVVLRGTARVQGDITAPRVVLEDGANFRGGVDMGAASESRRASGDRPTGLRSSTESPKKPQEIGTTPATAAVSSGTGSGSGKESSEKAAGTN
jgi:cytoskeletal protein CcmA (bactofilin family)